MEKLRKYLAAKFKLWATTNNYRLIIFNIIVVFLFLLRSAGYFNPYFPITVNVIVFTALMLSIFMLGARSGALFIVAIIFWVFAGVLQLLQIDVWAERTTIYVFESLILAVILFIVENFRKVRS